MLMRQGSQDIFALIQERKVDVDDFAEGDVHGDVFFLNIFTIGNIPILA